MKKALSPQHSGSGRERHGRPCGNADASGRRVAVPRLDAADRSGETDFWREHHAALGGFDRSGAFEDYEPAYRLGWESFRRRRIEDGDFDGIETALARAWDRVRGGSCLTWDLARDACEAAWHHARTVHRARITLAH